MTHHYDYRLPPDTFLARRDSNFYIGAAATSKPLTFKEQIDLARSALRELRVIATVVARDTNPGTANAGTLGVKFASETAPRLIDEAERDQDVAKLVRVQGATQRIVVGLKPEVLSAILSRFLAIVLLGPVGALVSAETLDKAKEAGMDAADAALEAGKNAIKTGAKGVVKLGQDILEAGLEQAGKKPVTTALFVGGALGILALYFYINKKRVKP